MEYIIKLSGEQIELLRTILEQTEKIPAVYTQTKKTKKLTKIEQTIRDRREYRAIKAAQKTERHRKNNL